MARIRLPFADSNNNRSYLNTTDYLLFNAYIERGSDGPAIVKRPGWKSKLATSSIVTTGRGFVYSSPHSLYYACIGDALFKISNDLSTVTEIIRKTPTSASYSAAAGGTLTYVFAAAHGFIATQQVNISGITGATLAAGYTGVKTIAAVSTTSVANDTFTVTGVGADPGAATLSNARVSPILTDSGKVYFEQTKNGTAQVTMLQIPKTDSYPSQLFMIASGGTVTRVTDADLPTDLIGAPVSVDSYLFTLSAAQQLVYNMDLEAPTSINSLAFVGANTYADNAVTLAKHHNQVVCFKEYSTEFFYDAQVAAPSSPLAKIPQQTLTIGCASAASVVQIGNNIIWLSRNQNGGLAVHAMAGGVPQKISTPFIDRILASMESFVFGENVDSFYISNEGHEFYILSVTGSIGTNQAIADIAVCDVAVCDVGGSLNVFKRTLVYDLAEQAWHEWGTYDSTTGTQSVFFGAFSVSGPHVSNSQDFTNTLIMEKATGDIYEMSPAPLGVSYGTTYKDGSRTITVKLVTNNADGGTRNRKRCNSYEILGDKNTSSTTLSIRHTDDDYQTWSTARTVDMSGARARLLNCGTFRRRAHELTHADDTPLRLVAAEIDVDQLGN